MTDTAYRELLSRSALGKSQVTAGTLDASQLFAVPRSAGRAALDLAPAAALPFTGSDMWTAYELSWLSSSGQPSVAIASFDVPVESPNLIESKSLKLYLQGFCSARFETPDAVRTRIAEDLSAQAGSPVEVLFHDAARARADVAGGAEGAASARLDLDALQVSIDPAAEPDSSLLGSTGNADPGSDNETIYVTDAFKSNCPVTGQPDFARIWIRARGTVIEPAGLLRYLVSYRHHAALHEQCVEAIFCDVLNRCAPSALAVAARFTRRGGLDINPQRRTPGYAVTWPQRTLRQ